jgi:hypothetical protein
MRCSFAWVWVSLEMVGGGGGGLLREPDESHRYAAPVTTATTPVLAARVAAWQCRTGGDQRPRAAGDDFTVDEAAGVTTVLAPVRAAAAARGPSFSSRPALLPAALEAR